MSLIKLYAAPKCFRCALTRSFFELNNIDYDEIDIVSNPGNRQEMYEKTGYIGAPVTVINNTYIQGFQRHRLLNEFRKIQAL